MFSLTPPSTHIFPTSGPLHMLFLSPRMPLLQILNSLASPFPLGLTEISPPQRSLSRPQSSTLLLPWVVSVSLFIPSSNVSPSVVMTVCLLGCLLCDTRDRVFSIYCWIHSVENSAVHVGSVNIIVGYAEAKWEGVNTCSCYVCGWVFPA